MAGTASFLANPGSGTAVASCEFDAAQRVMQAVEAVTANRSATALAQLARDLGARFAAVGDPAAYNELKSALSGSGIEAETLEQLQQFFSRTDPATRTFGGTGLGLILSDRLVHLLNGRIRVSSEPGKGSRFEFTILAKPAPQKAPPATADPTQVGRSRSCVSGVSGFGASEK